MQADGNIIFYANERIVGAVTKRDENNTQLFRKKFLRHLVGHRPVVRNQGRKQLLLIVAKLKKY